MSLFLLASTAFPQLVNQGLIVRDSSLGDLKDSPVPPSSVESVDYWIQANYGQRVGSTLFHSFSRFGIGDGETAAFEGDAALRSFIVRVTADEISRIDGQLRVPVNPASETSFFLMNPNGFIFGEDASLDAGGSAVFIGAASALTFEDGTQLQSTAAGEIPLVEVAPLTDFGFLSSATGDIVVDGSILTPGHGLHFTAENITIKNNARLSFDPVVVREANLSLRATELVRIEGIKTRVGRQQILSLRTPQVLKTLVIEGERIELANGAILNASGFDPTGTAGSLPGTIRLTASDSISITGQGFQTTVVQSLSLDDSTLVEENTGRIQIAAPKVTISGRAVISTSTGSPGVGGGIEIFAKTFELTNEARIQSDSLQEAPGAAGNILVDADRVRIADGASISSSSPSTSGADAGEIIVNARDFELRNASILTSSASGSGGNITLNISDSIEVDDGTISAAVTVGDGGNIEIRSGNSLVLRRNAKVLALSESPTSSGGQIVFTAPALAIEPQVLLDASSPGGPELQGVVRINAPGLSTDPNAEPLTAPLFEHDPERLLDSLCELDVEASRLVAAPGRTAAPDDLARVATNSSRTPDETLVWNNAQQRASTARAAFLRSDLDASIVAARVAYQASQTLPNTLRVPLLLNLGRTAIDVAKGPDGASPTNMLFAYLVLNDALRLANGLGDPRAIAYAWGGLSELYSIEGRWQDARALNQLALFEIESHSPEPSRYRLHWQAARLAWQSGDMSSARLSYQRAAALATLFRGQSEQRRSDAGRSQSDRELIQSELIELLLWDSKRLPANEQATVYSQVRDQMDRFRRQDVRNYLRDPCLETEAFGRIAPRNVSATAAIIHFQTMPDRVEIFVSRGEQIDRFSVPVSQARLDQRVDALRTALQKPFTRQFRDPARELYTWLIAPIEDILKREDIDTLVFSAPNSLAGVPFGALMRGNEFLIEQHAVALSTGTALTSKHPMATNQLGMLAAGLSTGGNQLPDLPAVSSELELIKSGFDGETLLDREFDVAGLGQALERSVPGILHIASHGVIGRNAKESFIETWSGKLDFDRLGRLIRRQTRSQNPLELIVLSACETASAEGRGELGLAGVALRAGAKSVIGALWSVSDESTRDLMVELYRALRTGEISKASALRQAQRSLIRDDRFSHPYYWSGFVLASDWR